MILALVVQICFYINAPLPLLPQPWAAATRLLFLGTGCAEPSKYRGASAILLQLAGGSGILMDCGEGTVGGLTRALGDGAAADVVRIVRLLLGSFFNSRLCILFGTWHMDVANAFCCKAASERALS